MATSTASGIAPQTVEPGPAVHDFDFYMGTWWVRHRRLKERLEGSDEWEEFEGTSRAWPILDGAGNIDDNVLEMPNGTYRAISLRTYEPWSERWSIWYVWPKRPGFLSNLRECRHYRPKVQLDSRPWGDKSAAWRMPPPRSRLSTTTLPC